MDGAWLSRHSDLRKAMSMEKRYFTSDLTILSKASLIFWMRDVKLRRLEASAATRE
jgi:hypothetical protein